MATDSCPNCGASVAPGANYCSECGESVDADDSWGATEEDSWDDGDDSWDDSSEDDGWTDSSEDDGWTDSSAEYAADRRSGGDTTLAAITHVLAIFTWAIGPLIVLLVTEDPFVEENARNALNWQIVFTIYMILSGLLIIVLVGIALVMIVPLLNMAFCVIAAVKAADGEAWSYPATPDIV